MNNHESIIELTDSYKISHWRQYPEHTTNIFSFFESRGGRYPAITFFGLQYFLKRYLVGSVVTMDDINEARDDFALHFNDPTLFNAVGWERIVNVHGGRLPVVIKAIPEGTTVPVSNALMTIENTDPELPWLTNYLETILSQVWYPTTVCTQSRMMRKTIMAYLEETGDPAQIDFKLHDFGFRGSTSVESAGLGGAAHLVNFKGTDNLAAVKLLQRYYGERMAGGSIPAAEHSTITSWGREHEADAYRNMLEAFPTNIVAVVSDSYDIFRACRTLWGDALKEKVLNRAGTLVVRPDSGNPPEVVVRVLEILDRAFGSTANDKGYRVLNPKIRVIQGDGIDPAMLGIVLEAMKDAGWSAENVAFGSGGGLLQKVNRDTQKFAFKCSAAKVNGYWRDVYKDPATDHGKRSKAGCLILVKENGGYRTLSDDVTVRPNELVTVFKNGELTREYTLAEIRERALRD